MPKPLPGECWRLTDGTIALFVRDYTPSSSPLWGAAKDHAWRLLNVRVDHVGTTSNYEDDGRNVGPNGNRYGLVKLLGVLRQYEMGYPTDTCTYDVHWGAFCPDRYCGPSISYMASKKAEKSPSGELYDMASAVALTGLTESQINKAVQVGDLRAFRSAGTMKFRRDDLDLLMRPTDDYPGS